MKRMRERKTSERKQKARNNTTTNLVCNLGSTLASKQKQKVEWLRGRSGTVMYATAHSTSVRFLQCGKSNQNNKSKEGNMKNWQKYHISNEIQSITWIRIRENNNLINLFSTI
jgi:hypothetical protein